MMFSNAEFPSSCPAYLGWRSQIRGRLVSSILYIKCFSKTKVLQYANDLAATAGFKVKYYDPILQQLLKIKNFESLSELFECNMWVLSIAGCFARNEHEAGERPAREQLHHSVRVVAS